MVGERGGWKGVDGKGWMERGVLGEVVLKRAIPGRRRRIESGYLYPRNHERPGSAITCRITQIVPTTL